MPKDAKAGIFAYYEERITPMKGLLHLLFILLLGGLAPTHGETATPAGAQVPVKVDVPDQWRTAPFDRERIFFGTSSKQ